jgi:hypothetical protein
MPKSSKGSTRTRKSAPAAKKERPAAKAKAVVAAAPPAVSDAPRPRRAVFIDVENTSSEAALIGALEQLVIDRQAQPTEVMAVGNWRVISHQVARMLAQRGARLLHSAPATGVKDWSDLAIAVHAGIWLGRSSPGDVIEIISADRAFDAVADAAMSLGVVCHRLTYGGGARHAAGVEDEDSAGPRRRRRGRRGNGRRLSSPPPVRSEAPRTAVRSRPAAAQPAIEDDEDRHSASHQQIIATIARLTARDPARGVNLDLLINALKGEGFLRPPGSPRLVTRLRKMKDVEVSPTGMVRLAGEAAPGPALAAPPIAEPTTTAGEAEAEAAPPAEAETAAPAKRASRRRSRGGRGRRKRGAAASGGGDADASPASAETAASSDDAELQSA